VPDPDRRAPWCPRTAEVPPLDHDRGSNGLRGSSGTRSREWVDPVEVPPTTGDPKDDYLVALHRNCQADLLVSGDSDLLDLAADDVTVLTPGALLDRLQL
jgi:hypothetical protein